MTPNPLPPPRTHITLGSLYNGAQSFQLAGTPDQVTDQTIEIMRAGIIDTDRTQVVHRLATAIAAAAPNRDFRAQLLGVYNYLAHNINFKRDTHGREHLRHPDQLVLEIANSPDGKTSADCDDVAMLGAALVRHLGMQPILYVMAPGQVGNFEHVYFGAQLNGHDIPMDPQERTPFGNHTPPMGARRRRYYL